MGIFFGTDGIRGVVNDYLTFDLAYKCGNAVASSINKPTIIVGGDTRITRSFLSIAFSGGAMSAGANIIDVGICPTAGIAYITKTFGADYGAVISASHNPAKYNGIKIFDRQGFKLGDKSEEMLERRFIHEVNKDCNSLGTYTQNFKLIQLYENHLVNSCKCKLNDLIIVIDASNGASYKIASNVFKRLGANVIETYCNDDGDNINNNCGSMYPQVLAENVKKYNADMGFAFDGDADRIIACDENGNILDGDRILYILANYLKDKGKLNKNTIVATRHTNMGIENALNNNGIKLIRTDIGDKYVSAKIEEDNLSLGGEKSGHIILRELSTTGDGILTGIKIAEIVKKSGKNLSDLCNVRLYHQSNIDCVVKDKVRVINSEVLQEEIIKQEKILGQNSRIMVRVSGTEPKIRIMCECQDEDKCNISAKEIEKVVKEINALY